MDTDSPTSSPTRMHIPDEHDIGYDLIMYGSICVGMFIFYHMLLRCGFFVNYLEPRGKRFYSLLQIMTLRYDAYDEREFISRCGMDVYMTLRCIRFMAVICFLFTIYGLSILLPAYFSSQNDPSCDCQAKKNPNISSRMLTANIKCVCSWIDRSSLANIGTGEPMLLWVSVSGIFFYTVVIIYMLAREYHEMIRIRAMYWRSKPPHMYTILIDDMPSRLNLNTLHEIEAHFNQLFPGQVFKVDPVRFRDNHMLQQLKRAGRRRIKVFDELSGIRALVNAYGHVPACHSCLINGCTVRNPEAYMEKLEARLRKENERYEDLLHRYQLWEQDEKDERIVRPFIAAFVTFKSAAAAAIATQSVIDHRFNIVAENAPEPADIRWESPGAGLSNRLMRVITARTCMFLLVLIWATFVSFVGALTSSSGIKAAFRDRIPEIPEFLDDHPGLVEFLDRVSPLILSSLLSIVNPLVCILARLESRVSESHSQRLATVWSFYFLILQVFIVYGISNTLLQILEDIFYNPPVILDVLCAQIPYIATFYIQFIITKFFTLLCMDLFRVTHFVIHFFRRCLCGASFTPRDQSRDLCGMDWITVPPHCNLSSLNSQLLLIFFIVTCYATLQPIILPVAFVFFYCATLTYAKTFSSISLQRFDSGGDMWPTFFWCFSLSIVVAQLLLLGMLGLHQAPMQSTLVFLLFCGTMFILYQIDFRYSRLVLEIPLDIASEIDRSLDEHVRVKVLPTSTIQYDELTPGQPNYYGKDLYDSSSIESEDEQMTVNLYDYSHPVTRELPRLEVEMLRSHHPLEEPLL